VFLHASSGAEALKILLSKEVDLVILDVQMPDMDGFEVANILKSNKRTKDIPVIFALAERTEHRSMKKGFEEGAIDYLYKPLDPEIARAKVAILLQLQLQKRELMDKNLSLTKSALLINNSADIIGIIDAATLKIEEVNNAFTHILGYEREEVLGSALQLFLSNEDRRVVQHYSSQSEGVLSFETRIYCKDRRVKWLQWKVVVNGGKWYVNARDITDLKEGERIRNYLATVVKQSNNAVYIHNCDGEIITWNEGAQKIYGFTEAEALKMKVWNIIPPHLHTETEHLLQRITGGEKIHDLETQRITKHGKLIEVLFSANAIDAGPQAPPTIAITETDITEQKIAGERVKQLNADLRAKVLQVEHSNKELESFSYSVSHDLRAPLRALNGYSKILEEDYGSQLDNEARRLLGNIKYNSQKMGVLIDDLLAFSRLGRKEVKKVMVNANDMVQSVLNEMKGPGNTLPTLEVAPLAPGEADPVLLHQVWVNLISNAVKYSSKVAAPLVKIGCTETDKEVTYFVSDNGAGFDMRYIDKLFGVFQRLHDSSEFDGTGIGLAIVQRVIAKHRGRVWAEGAIDKGATFYFTLPKV
jgi:PAS domain S-box-containing protein